MISGQPSIVDNTYEVTKAPIIFENLQALIIEFGDCIVNPLLNNYEFYEKIDLNYFII